MRRQPGEPCALESDLAYPIRRLVERLFFTLDLDRDGVRAVTVQWQASEGHSTRRHVLK